MASTRKQLIFGILGEGGARVEADIKRIAAVSEQTAKRIAVAFGTLRIGASLERTFTNLRTYITRVSDAARGLARGFTTLSTASQVFNAAILKSVRNIGLLTAGISAAVFGVGSLAKRFGENAERITQQADALGLSTDEFQSFEAAARDSGTSISQLDRVLAKFTIGTADMGDEVDESGKKIAGSIKHLEDFKVQSEGGGEAVIKVTRGARDLSQSLAGFNSVTKTGAAGLKEYAANLLKLKTTQEQLAIVSKDFGSRGASQTLVFLRNLAFQFDETARAAAGLVPQLTKAELAIGVDLDTAVDNLTTNLLIMRDRLVAVFGSTLTKFITRLTFLIQKNEKAIVAFAERIATLVSSVFDDLFSILEGADSRVKNRWLLSLRDGAVAAWKALRYLYTQVLVPAFNFLLEQSGGVADTLNSLFGTDFTGGTLLAAIAVLKLVGAFDLLVGVVSIVLASLQLLRLTWTLVFVSILRPLAFLLGFVGAAIGAVLGVPAAVGVAIAAAVAVAAAAIFIYWDEIVAYGSSKLEELKGYAKVASEFIAQQFNDPNSFFNTWLDSWKNLFSRIENMATALANTMKSIFSGVLDFIIDKLNDLIAKAKEALRSTERADGSGEGGGGGSGSGFADGGFVRGPGSGTSDSIPARLSAGEFVVRAAAVRKYGLRLLQAINDGTVNLKALKGLRFNEGGLVPAFAQQPRLISYGGNVRAGGRPVVLNIGTESYEMRADESVIDKLERAAIRSQTRSTGKKPGWMA